VVLPEAIKRVGSAAAPSPMGAGLRAAIRWGGLVVIVAGVLVSAFALLKAQPKAQLIAIDDAPLLAVDKALGDAVRAGDKAAARRLLALQFSFVDADGKSHTRKEFLADAVNVAAAPAGDVTVRSYGLLATVTGRHKSAHNADVFFLDVWVKQKGAWRALLLQDVPIAVMDTLAAVPAPPAGPQSHECKNPCQTIPYRVRSPAEQEVVNAFQATMKAVVADDAGEWGKYVADEFAVYASGRAPVTRSERIATIERCKENDVAPAVGEVQTMRLSVYGDGALMIASEAPPNGSNPPYRAARVWVRRNGQWLMAISLHTDVK
jgi:Domain of unknown function (DUF4440)